MPFAVNKNIVVRVINAENAWRTFWQDIVFKQEAYPFNFKRENQLRPLIPSSNIL